jgi:Glycosyltransferase family 92
VRLLSVLRTAIKARTLSPITRGDHGGQNITVRNDPLPAPAIAPDGIAIVAIFKDEMEYLEEWLEFHLTVGVDRFYLYDNGSSDEPMHLLRPYVASGVVRVIPWTAFAPPLNAQRLAYSHACANVDADIGWISILDIDEFLFAPDGKLRDAVSAFADFSNVIVPRFEFGDGGHETRPAGLVTENYLKSSTSFASQVKSLLRPWTVRSVGTHKASTAGPTTIIARETPALRVNHYFTKSKSEFRAKLERGYSWRPADRTKRKHRMSEEIGTSDVEDRTILPLVEQLKARMKLRD